LCDCGGADDVHTVDGGDDLWALYGAHTLNSPASPSVFKPLVVQKQASDREAVRLLQQFRLVDQVNAQRFAAGRVIGPASDLDQAVPAVLEAVPWHGVAQVRPPLVFQLRSGRPPDLAGVNQLTGLMADLSNERSNALGTDNLVSLHGGVEYRGKKKRRLWRRRLGGSAVVVAR